MTKLVIPMNSMESKILSPQDAIQLVSSGQNIVVAHLSAEPRHFYELIGSRVPAVTDVRVYGANPSQDYPCLRRDAMDGPVSFEFMFLNPRVRQKHKLGHISYAPSHMSRWSSNIQKSAFRRKSVENPIDVFWGSCSLPDELGMVSLGLNCCYESELLNRAKTVILEINPQMPYTFGATQISQDQVTYFIHQNKPMPSHDSAEPSPEELKIGSYVADLVQNGSTIQLGIGGIPNAIGMSLLQHKDLGIHTEMINDAVMNLSLAGVVTGRSKTLWPEKIIGAFVYGSQELYKFVNRNPRVELHPAALVNDRNTIARNHKMTSINTAVEVDLTGQVCSESIGHGQISGVGGASDTHVGAQYSAGGRGIIALRSTTKDGMKSKIVPALANGAKVSISRNDIDTVVTEYGVAELQGKSVCERARSMIAVAHPKFRDELRHQAQMEGYL